MQRLVQMRDVIIERCQQYPIQEPLRLFLETYPALILNFIGCKKENKTISQHNISNCRVTVCCYYFRLLPLKTANKYQKEKNRFPDFI